MEVLFLSPVPILFVLLLINIADGNWLTEAKRSRSGQPQKSKSMLTKMQRNSEESDWSYPFDHNLASLETHLITESNNMLNGLFEETGTGNSGNERIRNDLGDLMNQLRDVRTNMDKMSTAHANFEKRISTTLRERSESQQNTMNVENFLRDLNEMSSKLAEMSGSVSSLSERASDISLVDPDVTRPADCHEVKACNGQYVDGEYFIYPRALEGRKVKVFCSGMAGPDPKEYVTLHNTNTGTYNYSLRTDNDYCTFRDRVGDAVSTFRKIRLDVQDMSVQRYDFTYADIMEEDPNVWKPPKYGAGGGCTWDYVYRNYRNCIAPGGFVIDTSGTGLIVDPELQWMSYGYGGRLETVYRSNNNAHVTAACDGWCAWCFPVGEMILQLEPAVGLIGEATEPMCV